MKINLTEEAMFYTLQGEGKYAGHPSLFIRTSGCNLRCAWKNADGTVTQCDTPYSSFNPEKKLTDVEEIKEYISQYRPFVHVVITGGEPMLQKNIGEIIDHAKDLGHLVTIETNGTTYFENKADFFSISPKLKNSSADEIHGMVHETRRMNFQALAEIIKHHDYQFKFVYNHDSDIEEIEEVRSTLLAMTGIDIDSNIWLMPQGVNESQFNEKAQRIWHICKNRGWKFTDRLHIRTYGQKKGV